MTIRRATIDDVAQLAAVHVQSWQAAYRSLLPDDFLDSLSVERRIAQWQAWLSNSANDIRVYEVEGQVVGFVSYGRTRDEDLDQDNTGEIYAIYLLPDQWGKGFGAALMQEGLTRLQEHGYRSVSLWVLRGNKRAIRFYEQFGFKPDGKTKVESRPGLELHELRYVKFLDANEG
ncbi:MAG: GNAT family N-acetyltransferase [Anaerolineaceae bacterium]|nr:GNAT family N-acetyltransferase [Anaerolineaceae bacterium]